MRKATALALGVLLPLLGFAGAGQAQPSAVQVQGIVQAVDCQAQTVVLSAPNGSNTISAADYTAVVVNSTSVPFCSLEGYIGDPATAWLIANGNQFLATQIDLTSPVAAPAPAPTEAVAPVPIVGVVLGTVIVAGLVYLLVHGPDGDYYRYPYYGEYYRHYYRPEYRPYTGYYPVSAPIITVAPAITGLVLGIVVINNLQFILTRDRDGRLYRYPYYGPYHEHYYRPAYRPYAGTYRNAPVRQGDPRWDAPAHMVSQMYRAPVTHAAPQPTPVVHQPVPQRQPTVVHQAAPQWQPTVVHQAAPQWQPTVVHQAAPQWQPTVVHQAAPQWQPTVVHQAAPQRQPTPVVHQPAPQRQLTVVHQAAPQRQPTPVVHQPVPQRQPTPVVHQPAPQRQQPTLVHRGDGRGNMSRGASQQCGDRSSGHSCSSDGPAAQR